MTHIKEIHFASRDPWAGSTNLLETTPYLRKKGIKAFGLENILFETAILALKTDFMLRFDPQRFEDVVKVYLQRNPGAGRKAYEVFNKGVLQRMKDCGLPSEGVLSELVTHIG